MRSPLCTAAQAINAAARVAIMLLKAPWVAKKHPGTKVRHDNNRAFTFFLVDFDVSATGAGSHSPVHIAHIVTSLVAA